MDRTIANPLRGIAMKVLSIALFITMQSLVKLAGPEIPTGEVTFFRSFFALVPIMAWLAFRGELAGSFRTANPMGHFYRGFVGVSSMGLGFLLVVIFMLIYYRKSGAIAVSALAPVASASEPTRLVRIFAPSEDKSIATSPPRSSVVVPSRPW